MLHGMEFNFSTCVYAKDLQGTLSATAKEVYAASSSNHEYHQRFEAR
jgi:hypothetical protein